MPMSLAFSRLATALTVALTLAACTASQADPATTTTTHATTLTTPAAPSSAASSTRPAPQLSDEADAYLREAIALMQEWSINRDRVDWEAVTALAYRLAEGARTPAETHRAVAAALGEMHDDHSVFLTPAEASSFDSGTAAFTDPLVEVREDRIGYVSIGHYRGNIGDQADAYAADLATRLSDTMAATCGWIVDLRSDTGGNMWPMLGGLAPLLGEGHVGSFSYPSGRVEPWRIVEGVAFWDEQAMVTFGADIPIEQPPVAVLIGPRTASSGEATTVAFRGRPDTRLFGQPTAGLTTSNEPLPLSDGAMLILTMSVFTDRSGQEFGQHISVAPDHPTDNDPTGPATEWLLSQDACAGR